LLAGRRADFGRGIAFDEEINRAGTQQERAR